MNSLIYYYFYIYQIYVIVSSIFHKLDILQYLIVPQPIMSLGQSSYYEAKVFLKALIDAHRVLEQEAIQKAKIDRLKYYEKAILSGVNSGHFKLNGQSISKTSTFNNSRIFEASQFVKNYFSKNFSDFNKLKSANELAISFEKNLK